MKPFSISNVALTLAITSALAGCGGNPDAKPTTGKIVDGYVAGATVILDVNDNRKIDSTDPTTTANATGDFNFTGAQNPNGRSHMVFAKGGTDISTGLPFVGQLSAPPGATQVTPLTSVVMAQILASGNLPPAGTPISTATATAAAASVATSLGLPASVPLLTTDPVAVASTTPALIRTTAAVQVLLQQVTSVIQASAGSGVAQAGSTLSNALYQNALSAVASNLTTSSPVTLSTLSTITSNVVSVATTKAQADTAVTGLIASPSTLTGLSGTTLASAATSQIASLVTTVSSASATTLASATSSPTNPATIAQASTAAASAATVAANNGTLPNVLLVNSYKVNGTAVANGAVTVTGPVASATLTLQDVGPATNLAGQVSLGFDLTEATTTRKLTIVVDKITLAAGPGAGQITATVGQGSMTTAYYVTSTGAKLTSAAKPTVTNGLTFTQKTGSTDVTLDIQLALAAHPTIMAATNLKGTFTATAAVSGVVMAKDTTHFADTNLVAIPNGVSVSGYGTTAALTVQ